MSETSVMEKLSSEFSEIIEKASASVVLISGRRVAASGIVWNENLVVTADHSLRGQEYSITTSSGETIGAALAGRDPSTDIAILRAQKPLPELEKELDSALKPGQMAISVGRANGGRLLATLAIVSGSDATYRNWRGGTLDRFIRLDQFPYPGFSGSALILPNGKIAGMNTSAFSRHFGLTVPASNIHRLVQRLSTQGYVGRPYLGVMMQPVRLPEPLRKQSGADLGLLVMGTEPGSPAEQAGLMLGDVLVRLNDKTINSMEAVQELLSEISIGKEVKIGLLRGGQSVDVNVKIGERPQQSANK